MAENNPTSNNLVIGDGVTFKGSISAPGKAIINGSLTIYLLDKRAKSLASCVRAKWTCMVNSTKISAVAHIC
jgi:hypothetical protein